MLRTYTFNGLREFGFCILNDMTFVQDTVEPVRLFEMVDIVPNHFVRRDDDIVRVQFG